jgi:hypothetical protein
MLFLISCECGVDHFGRSLRRLGPEYRLGVLIKVIQDVSMSGRRGGPHRPPHGLSGSNRLRRSPPPAVARHAINPEIISRILALMRCQPPAQSCHSIYLSAMRR